VSDTPTALRPVLALDLGGTQLRTALITPAGEVHERRSRPPRPRAADLVEACVEALTVTRDRAALQHPTPGRHRHLGTRSA
jgi:predicted NBD/HSP70 family sugar kinase